MPAPYIHAHPIGGVARVIVICEVWRGEDRHELTSMSQFNTVDSPETVLLNKQRLLHVSCILDNCNFWTCNMIYMYVIITG